MSKGKQLSIKFKRVAIDGEKYCEITDIQGFSGDELPELYFLQYPIVVVEDGQMQIITNDKDFPEAPIYKVGDILCEYHFNKLVRIMQVCGEKLHNINEMNKVKMLELKTKNDELAKVWNGEEEIVI